MEAKLIKFNLIKEDDGDLTVFESNIDIPFDIKRVFSIYNIPDKKIIRANHASENSSFIFQIVSGSVDIVLKDVDDNKQMYHLDRLDVGLYIPKMTWIITKNFSREAILQVYASEIYEKSKYINDYKEFNRKGKLVK